MKMSFWPHELKQQQQLHKHCLGAEWKRIIVDAYSVLFFFLIFHKFFLMSGCCLGTIQ